MTIATLFRAIVLVSSASLLVAGCESSSTPEAEKVTAAAPAASAPPAAPAPSAPPAEPAATAAPRQESLEGGPYPTLLVAQAQFVDSKQPDGSTAPVPGPAKLTIIRETPTGWDVSILEDPDSNVFHKAMPFGEELLTIGGNQAMLKTWELQDGTWSQETHWNPKFGGKFDRLRDVEIADVDADGQPELVVATHDQGVIAIVHPSEGWRVEQIDQTPSTFVHEIEVGDVDGDGAVEIFATPSKPNKLDQEQPGEVTMYQRSKEGGWTKSIVDAPGDTHAKEILVAETDGAPPAELYIVWEGAFANRQLVKPVSIKKYLRKDGKWESTEVTTVPDRQMRATAAGDVNGDGKIDLVAAGLGSGLWLIEQGDDGWTKAVIDESSSGFEHPILVADLDDDGTLEIYVVSEDQGEVRRYRWKDGSFEKTVVAEIDEGDISWNVQEGNF